MVSKILKRSAALILSFSLLFDPAIAGSMAVSVEPLQSESCLFSQQAITGQALNARHVNMLDSGPHLRSTLVLALVLSLQTLFGQSSTERVSLIDQLRHTDHDQELQEETLTALENNIQADLRAQQKRHVAFPKVTLDPMSQMAMLCYIRDLPESTTKAEKQRAANIYKQTMSNLSEIPAELSQWLTEGNLSMNGGGTPNLPNILRYIANLKFLYHQIAPDDYAVWMKTEGQAFESRHRAFVKQKQTAYYRLLEVFASSLLLGGFLGLIRWFQYRKNRFLEENQAEAIVAYEIIAASLCSVLCFLPGVFWNLLILGLLFPLATLIPAIPDSPLATLFAQPLETALQLTRQNKTFDMSSKSSLYKSSREKSLAWLREHSFALPVDQRETFFNDVLDATLEEFNHRAKKEAADLAKAKAEATLFGQILLETGLEQNIRPYRIMEPSDLLHFLKTASMDTLLLWGFEEALAKEILSAAEVSENQQTTTLYDYFEHMGSKNSRLIVQVLGSPRLNKQGLKIFNGIYQEASKIYQLTDIKIAEIFRLKDVAEMTSMLKMWRPLPSSLFEKIDALWKVYKFTHLAPIKKSSAITATKSIIHRKSAFVPDEVRNQLPKVIPSGYLTDFWTYVGVSNMSLEAFSSFFYNWLTLKTSPRGAEQKFFLRLYSSISLELQKFYRVNVIGKPYAPQSKISSTTPLQFELSPKGIAAAA